MRQYLRLLRDNPEYTKLWLAQVISLMGDWFNTVVLSALVAQYSNGSGLAISIFLMSRFLPPLLVTPFTGVLLDRFNRKHLLVFSNLGRALIVPLFLLANSPDLLWLIYAVTIAQFTLSALFEPGQSAIIPALVKPSDIVEANTLMSVTWSVMLSVGAILGGAFAFIFGTEAALLADAITFAAAGLLITRVDYDPAQGRRLAKAAGIEYEGDDESDLSFREGLRYIRRTPQIAAALFVKFGLSLGNVDTLLTIFATQIFIIGAQGELSLGILYSALGVGAVMGPVLTNLINDGSVRRMRRLIGLGFVLLVLSWPILSVSGVIAVAAFAIFVRAMGGSINWTYSNIIIQKSAPDSKLGRMFSIDMAGSQLATVGSTLAHGALIDWLGVARIDLVILGTMVVSLLPLLLWAWVVPKLETMDEAAQSQTDTPVSVAGD